jgi:hypothetical protein
VIATGALVSLLALSVVYGVLPFSRRWSARESAITAKAEQLARLEALVDNEVVLRETTERLENDRERRAQRLLAGSTEALAASSLQTLVRGYAEQSRITLDRVDVAREFQADSAGLIPVPADLVVHGDVYGLVDFLFYLQNGEKLLVIDGLSVSATQRRRQTGPEMLSWTVSLHGFYVTEEGPA